MKPFSFAVCAFSALVAIAEPAAAQVTGYSGLEFVEAVKKSDGDKVQELLQGHAAKDVFYPLIHRRGGIFIRRIGGDGGLGRNGRGGEQTARQ